jgi:hypothetical protein
VATISEDQRYAELLTHLEFENWLIFVRGATHVIQEFTGDDMSLVYGVYIEARRTGVDLTEEKWRSALWSLGAYADFIERLERAVGPTSRKQSALGSDS